MSELNYTTTKPECQDYATVSDGSVTYYAELDPNYTYKAEWVVADYIEDADYSEASGLVRLRVTSYSNGEEYDSGQWAHDGRKWEGWMNQEESLS